MNLHGYVRKNKLQLVLTEVSFSFFDKICSLSFVIGIEEIRGVAGRDLIGVQNLIKKQQALIAEIANHEPQIDAVSASAEQMISQGHFLAPDIRDKLAQLRDNWRNLKAKAEKRRQELDDSLQVKNSYKFLNFQIFKC